MPDLEVAKLYVKSFYGGGGGICCRYLFEKTVGQQYCMLKSKVILTMVTKWTSVMKVYLIMEKMELPATVMGDLKLYLKVHLIPCCLHAIWWSSNNFQIKIANEKALLQLRKHLLTINLSSLTNVCCSTMSNLP